MDTASSIRTLCLVRQPDQLLLGFKKRGFGAGRWNGFGGKVEPGETIVAAASRELTEETTLTATNFEHRATLGFTFADGTNSRTVYVFMVTDVIGTPQETPEMIPRWFNLTDIPFTDMWAADRYWLPRLLRGQLLSGDVRFIDQQTLQHVALKEVALLPAPWHGSENISQPMSAV